ncbi:MAG: hypothetical protein ACRC56_01635 [Bosea sp. (in: a-proteobacteria)]
MDFFQQVVIDYLRADRGIFLNAEFCLQINAADNPDKSGPHWYVDVVAVDFSKETFFLCEVTYSKSLDALHSRLIGWNAEWDRISIALQRDASLPDWPIRPWLFVPESAVKRLLSNFDKLAASGIPRLPVPLITNLEAVMPWQYRSWNRVGEPDKSLNIPLEMRS